MSRYQRYPEYRDSGVEWIGEIPGHWEVKRLKYIASCNDESLNENTDPQYEIKYIDISSVNLSQGITHKEILPFEKAPSRARRIVRHGDTIVSTVRTYLKAIAPIIEPDENLIVSTGFAVIRSMKFYSYRFLGYFLQTEGFVGQVVANSVGVSYPAINANELLQFSVIVPPLEEQQAIASFLDRKTAQINKLITKKEELLKKLDEKRTALITRAVTKGLDPSVPMKESGVEWLGEIPKHWEVKKLQYICRISTGGKDTVDAEDDGKYPFYVRSQTIEKINTYSQSCEAVLTAGDGVGVGKVFHYVKGKFDFHQRVYMFNEFKKITGMYFYLFLKENFWRVALEGGAKSTVDSLRRPMISNFPFVLPPLEEQQAIADHIEKKTARIDRQKAQVTEAIERLKEYRSALITDAVTGKMDVHSIGKKESLST